MSVSSWWTQGCFQRGAVRDKTPTNIIRQAPSVDRGARGPRGTIAVTDTSSQMDLEGFDRLEQAGGGAAGGQMGGTRLLLQTPARPPLSTYT